MLISTANFFTWYIFKNIFLKEINMKIVDHSLFSFNRSLEKKPAWIRAKFWISIKWKVCWKILTFSIPTLLTKACEKRPNNNIVKKPKYWTYHIAARRFCSFPTVNPTRQKPTCADDKPLIHPDRLSWCTAVWVISCILNMCTVGRSSL